MICIVNGALEEVLVDACDEVVGLYMASHVMAICENLAPFLKLEAKTPKFVSCDFGFGLEIKFVACLK